VWRQDLAPTNRSCARMAVPSVSAQPGVHGGDPPCFGQGKPPKASASGQATAERCRDLEAVALRLLGEAAAAGARGDFLAGAASRMGVWT
jgi:hypothetical protein